MSEVQYKEARKDSKRWIACEVMKENANLPMREVLPLIVAREPAGFTLSDARSYYRWCVAEGFAPGVIEERTRSERTPKSTPKVPTLAPLSKVSTPEEVKKAHSAVQDRMAALRERLAKKTEEVKQEQDQASS